MLSYSLLAFRGLLQNMAAKVLQIIDISKYLMVFLQIFFFFCTFARFWMSVQFGASRNNLRHLIYKNIWAN